MKEGRKEGLYSQREGDDKKRAKREALKYKRRKKVVGKKGGR